MKIDFPLSTEEFHIDGERQWRSERENGSSRPDSQEEVFRGQKRLHATEKRLVQKTL